ncbi:hypothetical protein JTE90_001553 [Oedothorax gibbosus]|uniref:Uncharacterized protein n=1 Tax=Oedothorax gibbosus TaxID=931172 RepID=A0AAV6VLD8_9ARAC|nr:hypothetical protein JTE90_001553 [Oedothorax gibbosus]
MSLQKSLALRNLSKVCFFPRFYGTKVLRRKPIRVLNVPTEQTSLSSNENVSKIQLTKPVGDDVGFPKENESKIVVPEYEKLKQNDARFTKILTIIKNRKLREKDGRILLEGKRLINDAISAGMELKTIYFSKEKDLADINFKNQQKAEILKVLYKTLQVWSDLTTCPGVMGVFKRPTAEMLHVLSEPAVPVTLICDNIREPGNLGSLIRNAAAAGCENILLMKGCVDPWETKVLRAGCGGHFRIPIVNDIEWTHISNYIPKNSTILIADNSADIDGSSPTPEFINYDEVIEEDDEKKYVALNEFDQPLAIDETYNERSELQKYREINIPCYLYSSIKYPKESIVLYVGGESHGVDARITKLACDYGGKKVKIPMENCMESLNSTFAATIILYEIKKQFLELYVTK